MDSDEKVQIQADIIWLKEAIVKETPKKSSQTNKFEFLDGYRGSMALIVTIAHAKEGLNCIFLNGIGNLAQKYCISGFFLLSAFLLTYRLINDIHKANSSTILLTIQYFIRRFFRIYIVFALFSWAAIYGPEFFAGYTLGRYEDIVNILSLEYVGLNHLWTIAPEIKFYFLIPLICFLFYAAKRFQFIVLALCIAWTLYDQIFNYFNLKPDDIFSYSKHSHLLRNHFAVFLIGSELGMAFFIAKKSDRFIKWTKEDKIQNIMNYLSLLIAFYALIFHTETFNKTHDYK